MLPSPRQFPAPPRTIRKNPVVLYHFQYIALSRGFSFVFAAVGLFFLWQILQFALLPVFGTETDAHLIRAEEYFGKGGEVRHQYCFTYKVDSEVYSNVSDVDDELYKKFTAGTIAPNAPIRIRYWHIGATKVHEMLDPGPNSLYRQRGNSFCFILFITCWIAGQIPFHLFAWVKPRRFRRLYRWGIAHTGVIRAINKSHVSYSFINDKGETVERSEEVVRSIDPTKFAVGSPVTVLTLGRDSVIYELGPYLVENSGAPLLSRQD